MRPLTSMERRIVSLIEARVPLVLIGPPGVGKTAMVESVAQHLDRPVHVITPSILEPADVMGYPRPHADGYVEYLPPRWAAKLAANAILFIDELSTAVPLMQSALLRVVLERVVGDFALPCGVDIVSAANPPEQTATGFHLSPALQNRFVYLRVQASARDFVEHFPTLWGRAACCPWRQMIAYFIEQQQQFLHVMPKEEAGADGWAWPSPRSWEFAARVLGSGGLQDIECAVGADAARAFAAWRAGLKCPTVEELMCGSAWPRLPAYVLCSALNIAKYVEECRRLGTLTERAFAQALTTLARSPQRDLAIAAAAAVLKCRAEGWRIPEAVLEFERVLDLHEGKP